MSPRRFASVASALLVAGIAALASYSHMRHLALAYGQDGLIATLLPVSVDGMMVVATVALGDGRRHRWSAWLAFWIGVAASVVANVLAAQPSAIARCISAWPAVAFVLVVEVVTRRGSRQRAPSGSPEKAAPAAGDAPGVDTDADSTADTSPDRTRTPDPSPALPPVPQTLGNNATAVSPVVDTTTDRTRTPGRTSARPTTRTPGRTSVASKVAKLAARMPDADADTIAAKAGVSPRTVRRHLAAINADTGPDTAPVNGEPVPDLIRAGTAPPSTT